MTPRPDEGGVALLSVLLIIGLMAVVSAAMLDRIVIASHLAANAGAAARAEGYAQAVEAIARVRIGDALRSGRLPPDWDDRPIGFRVPGGIAVARLQDAGNCFNLNSLVRADRVTGATTAFPPGIEQFANLSALLGIPRAQGESIGTAIADWVDSDTVPLAGGAEDGAYAGQQLLPPNRMIDDASEIVPVAGMTPEIAARLLPWLCALPTDGLSPINIDTLPPERAELLAMLARRGLSVATARSILATRPEGGFRSQVEFWARPEFAGVDLPKEIMAQPQLVPRWFDLTITVELAGTEWHNRVLIDGEAAPARVVRRERFEP